MFKLEKMKNEKVLPLIKSHNELTIFSALQGLIENEVFCDNPENPTSVLIKCPGKNYLAGDVNNTVFNEDVRKHLNFWDQLTLDDDNWSKVIHNCHPNKYIRKYKRRHYELHRKNHIAVEHNLQEGCYLEKIELPILRKSSYQNINLIYDWTSDYISDENFINYGIGFYIRDNNSILSCSISDGHYKDRIAIGIMTAQSQRKKGFGIAAASATAKECFVRGFNVIEWICVDFNKGSRAIAEKIGFNCKAIYDAYTSYPPCENVLDLSEADWNDWGVYYENATREEPRLLGEQLLAFVKSNNVEKAIKTTLLIEEQQMKNNIADLQWISNLPQMISDMQSIGMCSNFIKKDWTVFVEKSGPIFN